MSETPTPVPFLRVVGAVLSAFVGIRKRQSADRDNLTIRPAHVIIAGVICALLFITVLVMIVRFITAR